MNRIELTNAISTVIQQAIIGPEGTGPITYGQIANDVITKLLQMNVLVLSDASPLDPLDIAPGATLPQIQEVRPLPSSERILALLNGPAPDDEDAPDGYAEDIQDPGELPAEAGLRAAWLRMMSVMQSHGIEHIQLNFSGGGDDGAVDGHLVDPAGTNTDAIFVERVEGATPPHCSSVGNICITDFAEGLYWQINEVCGHDGWYNNAGGHGDITFYASGRINLDHNENYEESRLYPYAFQVSAPSNQTHAE